MTKRKASTPELHSRFIVPVVEHLSDWSYIEIGARFQTPEGNLFVRLVCGHFRNEQMTDDPKKADRSDDWCYNGCHER